MTAGLDRWTANALGAELRSAGLRDPELGADLVRLCVRRGLASDASATQIAQAVRQVKAAVPGPFEPEWNDARGGVGLREFMRRYPDAGGDSSPAAKAFAERSERDRRQVREALLAVGA